jgi:hypothetical protein
VFLLLYLRVAISNSLRLIYLIILLLNVPSRVLNIRLLSLILVFSQNIIEPIKHLYVVSLILIILENTTLDRSNPILVLSSVCDVKVDILEIGVVT